MNIGLFSHAAQHFSPQWVFDAHSPLVSPATVSLIDGAEHIILGTKQGKLVCLTEKGEQQWSFDTNEKLSEKEKFFFDEERVHSFDSHPLVEDIDHDGSPEVLAGTEMGILYCISSTGRLLWSHDCKGAIKASPLVADINHDGKSEVIVSSADGKITVLSGRGQVIFEFHSDAPVEATAGVLKGKRTLIIFGNSSGKLTAITPAQEVAWQLDLKSKITAQPVFFTSPEEERMVIGTHSGTLFCLSEHGEVVWKYATQGSIYSGAALADLDGDGTPEIVFGSCDNNVYAVTAEGKRIWSYETDFWVTDTPLVADVNGDGKPEVIAGSLDHSLYVLDSQGEFVMDYVPGISGIVTQAGHYSGLLTQEPGEQAGKKLFQYKLSNMVVGVRLLEGRGKPSVVVSTKDGMISTLQLAQ